MSYFSYVFLLFPPAAAAAAPAPSPAIASVQKGIFKRQSPKIPPAAAGSAAGDGAAGLAAAAAAAVAGFQNPLCPDALPLAVGRGRRIWLHLITFYYSPTA